MLQLQQLLCEQPQGWAEIDWSSPLAQGLVLCANYSAPSVESVSGGIVTSTRTTEARERGVALSGTSGLVSYPSSNLINSAAGPSAPRTVFFLLSTTTTGNTVIAEKSNNSNFVCQTLGGKFSWRVASSSLEAVNSSTSINTGRPFAVAGRYSGTTASVFVDGWNEGSRSYTADITNSSPLVIGARSGNVAPFPGDIYCAFIWARALSDDEIASISANPWQLFKTAPRRIWSAPAAGGTHDATGALANAGGTTSGAAARTRAHPSSGSLANPGGQIAGSALHLARHAATGALTNPGATITGAAARRVNHGGTGALANPGGAIAGAAARAGGAVTHPSSGALVNPGAQLAGTAARIDGPVTHPSTGTLANPGASLAGSASRTPAPVTHSASGTLANPGAQLVGFATNESGALVDTHDGFWAKQYRKMWERKSPTIAEIVEELEEEPQEVLQAIPEVRKEVAREMGGRIDYEAITRNLELQRVIAKQIQVAIELRYAQRLAEIDEEDAEILLLI